MPNVRAASTWEQRVDLSAQEETFKVLAGKMGYFWESKDEPKVAGVGETITIPPGIKHTFFNADPDQPLEFDISIKPAVSGHHCAFRTPTG
jgi:quercetin dioxygenase-like cupin family protein